MRTFTLDPVGPFTLDTFRDFSCGLYRASRRGLRFAFPLDDTFEIVGVSLRAANSRIECAVAGGADLARVREQVARILSLDHDARPFAALCASDPILAQAYAEAPGFRPPVFYSPYAAMGWLVLAQRVRQAQAAALQARIAEAAGDVIEIEGERIASFPRPESILAMGEIPGLPDEKRRRLQDVAHAALEGELALPRLRAESYQVAHARLRKIHGVGEFTADGVLMRGSGFTDAVGAGYPMPAAWSPWRTWACVLLRLTGHQVTTCSSSAGSQQLSVP